MKIGIISSSGGGVFAELFCMLQKINPEKYTFFVITDRECAIEKFCSDNNINFLRIINKDNKEFSMKAKETFDKFGSVNVVLLFYTRIVTEELFMNYPTFNIHPSLLPAFSGFNPVKKAMKRKVKFFGTTLHLVDETVDGGKIIAQTVIPVKDNDIEEIWQKYSFIQKVYLSLLLVELIEKGNLILTPGNKDVILKDNLLYSFTANPKINDSDFIFAFERFQHKEGLSIII